MIRTGLVFFLFLSVTHLTSAEFGASDYDPEYLPYNYVEATEWEECEEDLIDFDAQYTENINVYLSASSATGSAIFQAEWNQQNALSQLEINKVTFGGVFKSCIDKGKEADRRQKEEQEAEQRAQERAERIQRALEECDLDYFQDEMTVEERMQTYDERVACEMRLNQHDPEPQAVEVAPVVTLSVQPVEVISDPVPQPTNVQPTAPTFVPPTPAEPDPVRAEPVQESAMQEMEATTTEVTRTPETIEVTQEELDRMVEERLNEKIEEASESTPAPQPEEKPSLFKRITNFLFGWMF